MSLIVPLVFLQPLQMAFAAAEQPESLAVGGQAIMEGIMMRNQNQLALAVRKADESIVAIRKPWTILFSGALVKKPWLRGFPILVETMVNGVKAMNCSAEIAAESQGEEIKGWHLALTLLFAVGLALLLFVVMPHLLTLGLGQLRVAGAVEGFSFHFWDGLIKFAMFIGYIALIGKLPDIQRVFAYHGAEHKSISAYEDRNDPVTPAKAARYSRLHPRCGTTFLLFVLTVSILLHTMLVPLMLVVWTPDSAFIKHSVVICFKLLLTIPISAIAYEIIRYAARIDNRFLATILQGPGLLLQRMTTREPGEKELEVALVALKEAVGPRSSIAITTVPYTLLEQK